MVNLLFLVLVAAGVLLVLSRWWGAWRRAKVDADPDLLDWLLAPGSADERRSGGDRRRSWRGLDRRVS